MRESLETVDNEVNLLKYRDRCLKLCREAHAYYNPQSEGSIAPDDPFLNIDWKLDKKNWILSDKDRQHPYIEKARLFDFKEDLYA